MIFNKFRNVLSYSNQDDSGCDDPSRHSGTSISYYLTRPNHFSVRLRPFVIHSFFSWRSGGVLYATLASLSPGLLLSGIRWSTVDQLLERTGYSATLIPKILFTELDNKDNGWNELPRGDSILPWYVSWHRQSFRFYRQILAMILRGGFREIGWLFK